MDFCTALGQRQKRRLIASSDCELYDPVTGQLSDDTTDTAIYYIAYRQHAQLAVFLGSLAGGR